MTLDDFLCLSVADCKRLGFLRPNDTKTGAIEWRRNGGIVASVGFATKTTGVPLARFSYEVNGTPVTYDVPLRWKRSNLNPASENGYYYFVCPATGRLCRKLYLHDGRFVSRHALGGVLYETQTKPKSWRPDGENGEYLALLEYYRLTDQRYRRETYNGRLTPYGRKIYKIARRLGADVGEAAT